MTATPLTEFIGGSQRSMSGRFAIWPSREPLSLLVLIWDSGGLGCLMGSSFSIIIPVLEYLAMSLHKQTLSAFLAHVVIQPHHTFDGRAEQWTILAVLHDLEMRQVVSSHPWVVWCVTCVSSISQKDTICPERPIQVRHVYLPTCYT